MQAAARDGEVKAQQTSGRPVAGPLLAGWPSAAREERRVRGEERRGDERRQRRCGVPSQLEREMQRTVGDGR